MSKHNKNPDKVIFNYIVVGDSNVGKSSLCNRYIFNKFHYDNPQTIGIDFFTKTYSDKIKLHIWDSAGSETYKSITRSYFLNTCAVILMFDVCNRQSFINLISYWIPLVKAECSYDVDFVIVGNKFTNKNRHISTDEGKRIALQYNTLYFETECKNLLEDSNILNVFDYLTIKVETRMHNSIKTPKGIKKMFYNIIEESKNISGNEKLNNNESFALNDLINFQPIKPKKCCFL